ELCAGDPIGADALRNPVLSANAVAPEPDAEARWNGAVSIGIAVAAKHGLERRDRDGDASSAEGAAQKGASSEIEFAHGDSSEDSVSVVVCASSSGVAA